MKHFKPTIGTTGYRSLQIGRSVPPGGVNLAYVDAPPLSSDSALQVFDYSSAIPANNRPITDLQVDMYADADHMLVNKSGVALYPMRSIMLTDEYHTSSDPTRQQTPLFYKYKARYNHYELGLGVSQTSLYSGHNITITDNGVPASKPYIVYVEPVDSNVYSIIVYASFVCDDTHTYELHYNKYSNSQQDPMHKEIVNAGVVYEEHSDRSAVISSPPETQIFSVEDAPDYAGHYIRVPDVPTKITRAPLLFRWRVSRNDGVKSVWHAEYILQKRSMCASDYKDSNGQIIYHDAMISGAHVARKRITKNMRQCFPTALSLAKYSINIASDIQIWHDGAWVANDAIGGVPAVMVDIQSSLLSSAAYAWINPDNEAINTGAVSNVSAVTHYEYPGHVVGYTIRGKSSFTGSQYLPGKIINHASKKNGATIAWDNLASFSGAYAELASPEAAIDGMPMNYAESFNIGGALWGRTKQGKGSMPAHVDPVMTINFANPATINTIRVMLGRVGHLKKVELLSGTTVKWSTVPPFTNVITCDSPHRRVITVDLDTPVENVNKMRITIGAEQRKVVDYWWILNLFGIKDKYVGEFTVHEATAFGRVTPQNITDPIQEWCEERHVYVTVAKNRPYSIRMRSIVEQLNLIPPDNLKDYCTYTVLPYVDEAVEANHPSCNIRLATTYGRPKTVANQDMSCSYSAAMSTLSPLTIDISTDDCLLMQAKRFTVKNAVEPRIFIDSPTVQTADEMWGLYVNNGRFAITDYTTGLVRHFFIPEFGTQAFSPELPYMQQIDEVAEIVDDTVIKVRHTPLRVVAVDSVPTNVTVKANGVQVGVRDWNEATGHIYLDAPVAFTGTVLVTYEYKQRYYTYRGYGDTETSKFYHLDMNPLPGHLYTDTSTGIDRDSSELLAKNVYLYIVPAYTFYADGSGNPTVASSSVLRHIIVDKGASYNDAAALIPEGALILGCVAISPKYVPSDAIVIDTRTRGGGLIDGLPTNTLRSIGLDGTGCMFDIGSWDGELYPCNGVIVVTLPASILKENGGDFTEQDIREVLDRCIAFGVYPIIRYR